jgi:23S rRNA pseudoU1915 N3-methylase RlmH
MSGKTPQENRRHLNNLLAEGKLLQYFSLGKDSFKSLAEAVKDDDTDEIVKILEANTTPGGDGMNEILDNQYDAQIKQLAGDLIVEEIDIIESEAIKSFKTSDVSKIRDQINEIELFSNISGIKRRSNDILRQLRVAELGLSLPENVRKIALEILEERGKDTSSVKTTKVIQKWGRNQKRALVVWGSRGIMAVEYLDKPVERVKKEKLKYIPTKKEFRNKKPEEILSRKGKFFTLKERNFVKSRKKKTEEQVIDDYFRTFGKVRTKTEIKKLIKFKK